MFHSNTFPIGCSVHPEKGNRGSPRCNRVPVMSLYILRGRKILLLANVMGVAEERGMLLLREESEIICLAK